MDPQGIARLERTSLGGLAQWVLLRGRGAPAPILLILHGGPGGAYIGVARRFFGPLESQWLVVNWDQRGAGLSYRRGVPGRSLTADVLSNDLLELARTVRGRFPGRRLVLMGHSLGTLIAPFALEKDPAIFDGYVAVSQAVLDDASERESYDRTLAAARRFGARKAVAGLTALGAPPYRGGGSDSYVRAQWTDRLGGAYLGSSGAAEAYRALRRGTEYTWWDLVFRLLPGIRFWSGHIDGSLARLDVLQRFPRLPVPVLFVHGRQDLMAPWSAARRYYERLDAPSKAFTTIEAAAHYPFAEAPSEFVAAVDPMRTGPTEPSNP